VTEPSTNLDTALLTPEERINHVITRRRQGHPFARIGDELGITRQGAHDLYWRAMEARTAPNVAAIRQEQNERLDMLHEKAMEIVNRKHVVVSGGKIVHETTPVLDDDGHARTDENGNLIVTVGEPLLDDGPTLRAIAELRALEAERAKLNGTYAPVQATINGEIRYEITGIDLDRLR
jgi:hypothetical protein